MTKKLILLFLIGSLVLFLGIAFAKPPTPEVALLKLGKSLYNDTNLSINRNQSCKSCHNNNHAFVDPSNANNPKKNVVSVGSIRTETGGLNAPTAAYAAFSPKMFWDGELFIGGIFWNGRAHGHKDFQVFLNQTQPIYSPLAEQAQGPFLNPVEMALPDEAEVVRRVANAEYAYLFGLAFGQSDFDDIVLTYDQIGVAIAFFEESDEFNKFSSAFDLNALTDEQKEGFALFDGDRAQCSACHVLDDGLDTLSGNVEFTDYSYDNLGIPQNPIIADKGVDLGLGAFIADVLDKGTSKYPESLVNMIEELQLQGTEGAAPADNYGKHKVSSLRNIALTPPYGHNGFFPNLTSIVQFYNTRDDFQCDDYPTYTPVTPALLNKGYIPGYPGDEPNGNGYCWPIAEVTDNVNTAELGSLGLTSAEVDSIVAFMEALTD
jgi:cytochrome c peroxidase